MAQTKLSDISIVVYFLIVVFNISSWLDIQALVAEFPLLVNRLPEGWELPSYLLTIVNCSKVSLFVFLLVAHFYKGRIPEAPLILFIIGCGAAALFCIAFTWDKTVVIGGKPCSLALMILVTILGTVDSLSLVVFLPYMAHFDSRYMSAYFVGGGLNKVIPAAIGLLQGVGEKPECINQTVIFYNESGNFTEAFIQITAVFPEPRFSIQVFFIIMTGFMLLSGAAFLLLHHLPYCRRHHVAEKSRISTSERKPLKNPDTDVNVEQVTVDFVNEEKNDFMKQDDGMNLEEVSMDKLSLSNSEMKIQNEPMVVSATMGNWKDYVVVCSLAVLFVGLVFAVSPTVLPYATIPYGSRAYDLAVRIGMIICPISAFVTLFFAPKSYIVASGLAFVATGCTGYQVYLACVSPDLPLMENGVGEALVILAYSTMVAVFVFMNTSMMKVMQEKLGAPGLRWGGVALSMGGFVPAIILRIIMSTSAPFKSIPPCPLV